MHLTLKMQASTSHFVPVLSIDILCLFINKIANEISVKSVVFKSEIPYRRKFYASWFYMVVAILSLLPFVGCYPQPAGSNAVTYHAVYARSPE